jgi:cytochrome P450 PksS
VSEDITSAAFKANSHPFYKRLRADAPVSRVSLPHKQHAWLITRYEDAVAALKDERFVKDKLNALTPEQAARQPWVPGMFKPLTRIMLDLDLPDHTRLRALVQAAFTPRRVEEMRERVQVLADSLLDKVLDQRKMDVIADYALPIPTIIIAEMLGGPVNDRHRFHRWTSAIVASNPGGWEMIKTIPHAIAFLGYLRKLIRERRNDPQEDLVSALVQAEEVGERLNEDELLAMVFLLLVAGHETTVNLIGNGMLALLAHPDQCQRLREDPTLIKLAVEELLRYDGPLETATERYAREDVTIEGVTIPRGELVHVVLASANRDERFFDRPNELDITRTPNKHLAFGQGIHYCLGASLARLEGQIAINTLLRRAPILRLAVESETLRWYPGLLLRGLTALPVTISIVSGGS